MSPELLHPQLFGFEDSRPTKESDCYALGMVIVEVLTGQAPFARDNGVAVMRKVLDGERSERPKEVWFTDDLHQQHGKKIISTYLLFSTYPYFFCN